MSTFLQFLFGGLITGAVLALIALGWVLIFNVSRVLNLAQGEFVMIGALSFITVNEAAELPILLAVVVALLVTAGIGVAIDLAFLRWVRDQDFIALVLVTLGASFVLREGAKFVFGRDPRRHPVFLGGAPLEIAGATVLKHTLLLWGVTLVVLGGLTWFFARTLIGKAMRACSDNDIGAQVVGIDIRRMRSIAFALSAGLGATAGILVVPLTAMGWDGGTLLGLKGFVAAVLGGMGSYPGAVVGGLLLGITEAMAAGYVSSAYKDVISLGLLLVFLLFMPEGMSSVARLLRPRSEDGQRTRGKDSRPQGKAATGNPPARRVASPDNASGRERSVSRTSKGEET